MGCGSSKDRLQTVDDSVHVMLKHDKKMQQKKGEQPHGFVPRAEHPLLKPKAIVVAEESDDEKNDPQSSTAPTTEATTTTES